MDEANKFAMNMNQDVKKVLREWITVDCQKKITRRIYKTPVGRATKKDGNSLQPQEK